MTTTTEREYRTIDKSAWGPGPWQDEPDKIQFVDEATGMPCLIKRVPELGHLCGYVGVSDDHPWYGKDYSGAICGHSGCYEHSPEAQIEVHGGLTYSAACQEGDEATSICHVPEPGESDHIWWFGFDAAHSGDLSPGMLALTPRLRIDSDVYRTVDYMRRECADLARQLVAREPAED